MTEQTEHRDVQVPRLPEPARVGDRQAGPAARVLRRQGAQRDHRMARTKAARRHRARHHHQ